MGRFSFFKSHTIKQASALLAVTALLSNGLGLARNLVFYRFIQPGELDIYFASFRIADLIFNILIIGAITSAVVPTISELITEDKEAEAHTLIRQLLTWASIIMAVIILLLVIAMPHVIKILVPGFDPEQAHKTIYLSRLLLIQAMFFSWSFLIGALLTSYRRFAAYAFAPLLYNLSLIIGGVLAGYYGVDVLIYAVILGSLLHFAIQFYEAYRLGFRPGISFVRSNQLKTILSLMVPRSISQGVNQLVLSAYTSLASTLPQGSISIFSGMNDLQTTPTVIVANSLATASFPQLSAEAAKKNLAEVTTLVDKIIRTTLYLMLPAATLGFVLRAQIVRLYFGIGAASWGLTIVAISTFAWFMVGILPSALVTVLARVFYATGDTRTPMIINIITSILGVSCGWLAISHYGYNVSALAMSEALIAISQALLYLVILHNRGVATVRLETLIGNRGAYLLGSILLALGSWSTLQLVDKIYHTISFVGTDRVVGLFIQFAAAMAVGLILYFGYSTMRNIEELQWLKKSALSRGK